MRTLWKRERKGLGGLLSEVWRARSQRKSERGRPR